jgi:hypothetical protein
LLTTASVGILHGLILFREELRHGSFHIPSVGGEILLSLKETRSRS